MASGEGWVFFAPVFLVGVAWTFIYHWPIRWGFALAICIGLVWAAIWQVPSALQWFRRISSRGWNDWAEREKIRFLTWAVLGIIGSIVGTILVWF